MIMILDFSRFAEKIEKSHGIPNISAEIMQDMVLKYSPKQLV